MMEARRSLRVRERQEDAGLSAFKVEEGVLSQESRWPLTAGKGRETNSPPDPPEGIQLCPTILNC